MLAHGAARVVEPELVDADVPAPQRAAGARRQEGAADDRGRTVGRTGTLVAAPGGADAGREREDETQRAHAGDETVESDATHI
ncbi:MAG: hypothetical protein HS111_08610 [Kofleriaceae bacterium]|nr:hypothetical protein [Kofleriaceae bacterium]